MLKVRCHVEATLDAKGRIALPSALRKAMQDAGVDTLVLNFERGAVAGRDPETFHEQIEKPVMDLDPFDPEVADFQDAVLSSANEVTVDGQGRILVPPMLRELAGLDKDVVINSILDHFHIWDKARWDARFNQARELQSSRGMPKKKAV
jgi:MraZ protein